MERKAVFFDIDGTLYDPVLGVPDSTKTAINQLIDNGHIPLICTGRTRAMIPDSLKNLGFMGIVAGAGTYVEYQEEIVHHKVFGPEFASDILYLLKEHHVKFIVEGPEYIYYDESDNSKEYDGIKKILTAMAKDKVKPLDINDFTMNKISCEVMPDSNLEVILPKLEEKFHLIRHQGTNFIELALIGYNKATGIKNLIEYLDIAQENTYAFGDSSNDLEMLQYVKYGIAMGNSYPEVREMARYHTKSLAEDGIYYGLKDFGLI